MHHLLQRPHECNTHCNSHYTFCLHAPPHLSTQKTRENAPQRLRYALRALRHRNFRLFTVGQSVSMIGAWMQQVAMGWLVYRLTNSAFLLGLVAFASQSPVFFLGPFAGVIADRANRHRAVFVITDGVDTGSRLKPPEVSAIASAIDVPVYLLTVVNPVDHPGGDFGVLTEAKVAESATLADLARWTGGDMRVASMPEHTAEAIVDLFFELRHQYLISFEPGEREGWHPLEIRARKNDLIVRARSGYMAGRPRPS